MRWSKGEDDLIVEWSGHQYDEMGWGNITREGGTKRDGGVLQEHLTRLKGCLGTTLVEELGKRGYDLTTLRFSVSKKVPGKPALSKVRMVKGGM